MSRSRKKFAHMNSDGEKFIKFGKKYANKKVRRTANIPNGKQYKKVSESWGIRDHQWTGNNKAKIALILSYDHYERYQLFMK